MTFNYKPFSLPIFVVLSTVLVISWSSGFVGIRFASEHAPISVVLFWRNLIAGLGLLPFVFFRGPKIALTEFYHQVAIGFAGMFLYLASFATAIAYRVPTGLVALIADLVPLAIAALSQPLLKHRLTTKQWIGTGIGVSGVIFVSGNSISVGHAPLFAYLIPVAGMVLFATITVMQKRVKAIAAPIYQSLAIQCLTASLFFAPWAASEGSFIPVDYSHFFFGIAWLVILATYTCYSVYYILLRHYPPASVSSIVFLSPPMTMIWAWAMFDEPLSLIMVLGTLITLFGVILALSRN